ncbi:hypothetical protein OUZ56_006005 [Daphnia magna]|uniref:Uncharacterized protein n=1 Tax=Daphnia magna TaxID=35525 RepID=A0ABQ9YUZ7_9CRUS|nr:hypothetical protein OUZ56_006005 [Daphnia magna]
MLYTLQKLGEKILDNDVDSIAFLKRKDLYCSAPANLGEGAKFVHVTMFPNIIRQMYQVMDVKSYIFSALSLHTGRDVKFQQRLSRHGVTSCDCI